MVSRSLEKMMLIAIGLTAVVIVGVPVLMFAIETLNTSARLEMASEAAQELLNATDLVDTGQLNDTTIHIRIPTGVSISSEGSTLTILFVTPDGTQTTWSNTFTHLVFIDPIDEAGEYYFYIHMVEGAVQIDEVVPMTV
ncbi:hypothetical protein EU524_01115 [Candidatus Thorarchaeota archaeon]|nr:MAG: hypothetical protein EU524_01115 [Candidatus Thorarchaeota archaeon]